MGSIKGFVGTFRNGVTAFGPLPIAIAMDFGFGISQIFFMVSIFVLFLSLIPLYIWFGIHRNNLSFKHKL
jgi:hypothetical protein